MFQGLVVRAWLLGSPSSTKATGAPRSPTNLLLHIDFTNTQSFQLLTPNITTTTQGLPTTSQPPTTPTTPADSSAHGAGHQLRLYDRAGPPAAVTGRLAGRRWPKCPATIPSGDAPVSAGSSSLSVVMFGFEVLLIRWCALARVLHPGAKAPAVGSVSANLLMLPEVLLTGHTPADARGRAWARSCQCLEFATSPLFLLAHVVQCLQRGRIAHRFGVYV